MKILFINSVVDYGSTGRIVRNLANALKEQGNEVLIAYGRIPSQNQTDTFYFGDKIATYTHVAMTRAFGRHGLHSTRATKRLIARIDSFNPDVIHLHNLHGYYLNVPMLINYLKNRNTKILWTLHDAWTVSGSSAYFDFNGCKTWDEGCVECNSTRDYPEALLFKRQKQNFAWKKEVFSGFNDLTFITPSQWLKDLLMTTFLKKYPIEVVHNGIDITEFKPGISEVSGNRMVLGVSNDWETRKGLQDIIELSKTLDCRYRITLVGLSEAQVKVLPNTITGIQRTQNIGELVKLYQDAFVFINPTYEDNYPTTNLEALACHTPVIAYDTGGNKEVANAPYMNIIEQGNVEKLKETIENLEDISFNSFDRNIFSNDLFVDEMLKLYK